MKEIAGLLYPVPPAVMLTSTTSPFATEAVAVAPVPAPVIFTVGALVYPDPPLLIDAPVITPPSTIALAVASAWTPGAALYSLSSPRPVSENAAVVRSVFGPPFEVKVLSATPSQPSPLTLLKQRT